MAIIHDQTETQVLDTAPDLMPDGSPRPNLPLLRKVLDHIDAHPEEWNQREWASRTECGTAYCIAGHALTIEGYVVTPAGVNADGDVDDVARQVLGLTYEESGDGTWWDKGLFNFQNDRATVQHWAERIAARAGERL